MVADPTRFLQAVRELALRVNVILVVFNLLLPLTS